MTQKDIKVSEANRKELLQLKLDLGYKNVNDIITKMIQVFNQKYKIRLSSSTSEPSHKKKLHIHKLKEVEK